MGVHEHKTCVFEVESNRNRTFVCCDTLGASLDFDSLDWFERAGYTAVFTGEKHYEASEHNFLGNALIFDTYCLSPCIQGILYKFLPILHSIKVFGAEERSNNFKIDHLLQTHDV